MEGPAVQAPQFLTGPAGIREGAGRELEVLLGSPVRQPRPLSDGAQVLAGDRPCGTAGGEEDRSLAAAGQEAGQQQGGSGLPVDPVGVPALGDDPAALAEKVKVGDVQGSWSYLDEISR